MSVLPVQEWELRAMPILTKLAYEALSVPTRKRRWSWPKRKQLESSIQSAVIAWVKKTFPEREGALLVRKRVGDARTSNGWPDYEFFVHGRYITKVFFVEFKRPGEKPTTLQNERITQLRNMGFKVHVIDDVEKGRQAIADEISAA